MLEEERAPKSVWPWGDLGVFQSKLAPSTVTKALWMGFASQQDQELEDMKRADEEGSTPQTLSWEFSQHGGYPEVSPPRH